MRRQVDHSSHIRFKWSALAMGPVFSSLLSHAQVTLPASSGVTVSLNSSYPGESTFTVPSATSITNAGAAVTGDNSQDWQFTNYGTVQNNSTASASALKLGARDLITSGVTSRVDNYGKIQSNAPNSGGPSGIQFTHGGIVYNYAGAVISGPDGVHTDGGSIAVYNDGQIISTKSSAIYTGRGALVENHLTGTISGSLGIVSNGAYAVNIKNEGVIATTSDALWFFGGGVYSILNTATGVIRGGNATDATALFYAGAQSQMVNLGLIQNPSGGSAVKSSADQNIFINAGTMTAGGTTILLSGNGNTVYNLGVISGATAISLTGNNNTIILGSHVFLPAFGIDVYGPGSNLIGNLVSTGADSAVQLTDSGSEDVSIQGFEHLVMSGNDWTLSGPITMADTAADALHIQSGTLLLTNTWQGSGTQIDPGATLLVGNAATPTATLNGSLGITNNGTLGGYGQINANVINQGQIVVADAAANLNNQGSGTLTVSGSLTNNGTINLRGQVPGNRLHLIGNLAGHGNLLLNTALGGDDSSSDRLVLDGSTGAATATGQTAIQIRNVGGTGDVTRQGILVVALENGAGSSATAFELAGRAVAGLYEYGLVRDATNEQWYLQSTVNPPAPSPTPTPTPSPSPTPPPAPTPRYRPEIGTYIGNAYAATTLFNHDLFDRQTNSSCRDSNGANNADIDRCSSWIRMEGAAHDGSAVQDQVDIHSHLWLIHGGTEFLSKPVATQGQLHAGVMAGYGHVNTWAQADNNPNHASGGVDSYTAGVYGTWFQNDAQRLGAYIDAWALYGYQNNEVSSDYLDTQSYHSSTASIALESGYTLNPFDHPEAKVTPFVQVIWNRYFGQNVYEQDTNTHVEIADPRGFTSNVGVRLGGSNPALPAGSTAPFVALNWRHSYGQTTLAMNGQSVTFDRAANQAGLKAGLDTDLTTRWRLRLQLGALYGDGEKQTSAEIGLQHTF